MATPLFTIPRFLLPQSSLIWRRANLGDSLRNSELLVVRYASSAGGSKNTKGKQPIVLEKPVRFNPPSHGARLPNKNSPAQKHYGGPLSRDEIIAQAKKEYPGLMAPKGSWGYWFWHSWPLHVFVTMGTLCSLAVYVGVENFKANSPFTDMLPSGSDFWEHPLVSLRTVYEVWQLTTLHNSVVVADKRKKVVDDVVKRDEYRKAHGMNQQGRFGNWTVKEKDMRDPDNEPPKREKWLGIF